MSTRISKGRKAQKSKSKTPPRSARLSSGASSSAKRAPVSLSYKETTGSAAFTQMRGKGDICIRHRELARNVTLPATTTGFSLDQKLFINPGNDELFPWLSQIATRYESYRFRKLSFQYRPTVNTFGFGGVYLAVDYDAADALPASKIQLMSYRSAVRCSVWDAVDLVCLPEDLHKFQQLYVLDQSPNPGLDIRLFDLGFLCVASDNTSSNAAAVNLGEIYVDYEVELLTPQMEGGALVAQARWVADGPSTAPFGTNAANVQVSPPVPTGSEQSNSPTGITFGQAVVGAVGLAAATVGVYKVGKYVADMYSATSDASPATAAAPTWTSTIPANGTVESPTNATFGVSSGANGVHNVSSVVLNVTRTPAAFTLDVTPAIGAVGLNPNSSLIIAALQPIPGVNTTAIPPA